MEMKLRCKDVVCIFLIVLELHYSLVCSRNKWSLQSEHRVYLMWYFQELWHKLMTGS